MTLKPCPFCGNEDIEVEREGTNRQSCIVICGWCGCRLKSSEIGHGADWNRRTAPPATKRMRKVLDVYLDSTDDREHFMDAQIARQIAKDFLAEWPGPAKEPDGPQAGTIRRSALAIQRATPDELRETLERSERTKEES